MWFLRGFFALIVLFLYAPIIVLFVFSFNDSAVPTFPLSGFTLRWYHQFLTNPDLQDALKTSAAVAALSSVGAVILGLLAAIALVRHRFRGSGPVSALLLSPLVIPFIVFGISLLLLFHAVGVHLGVKTVVNLRAFHGEGARVRAQGLGYEHISFKIWHPEDEDVVRFLRIVTDPKSAPVFVHCQHGSDRTGTMIAIYRIAVQGWDREEAMREMVEGGYGFHPLWENLKDYIRRVDIEAIRRKAGIAP